MSLHASEFRQCCIVLGAHSFPVRADHWREQSPQFGQPVDSKQ